MLPIAGQTAGPIGLELFVDTQGWPGSVIKNSKFTKHFFKLFFSRATPGSSVSNIYNVTYNKRRGF